MEKQMKIMKQTILQIIPCTTATLARYKKTKMGSAFTTKIVCLALIEEELDCGEKFQYVVGMDSGGDEISNVEMASNFDGYFTPKIGKQ